MMNEQVYDTSLTNFDTKTLAENLPNYGDSFDVTYTQSQPGLTFDDFAEEMFAFGTTEAYEEPYMYGSYEIF